MVDLKRYLKPLALIIIILLILELSSALILNRVIHSTRMQRFDTLYGISPEEYEFIPHPHLMYVEPHYLSELERYLGYLEKDGEGRIAAVAERKDEVLIVALGGSTTKRGYPKYTERYLNEKLQELNSSFEAVVFNFGVDGWSSFESIQDYFSVLRYLHPDVVIVHENHNDGNIQRVWNLNTILYYPEIGTFERVLIRKSRTYKLLKFT